MPSIAARFVNPIPSTANPSRLSKPSAPPSAWLMSLNCWMRMLTISSVMRLAQRACGWMVALDRPSPAVMFQWRRFMQIGHLIDISNTARHSNANPWCGSVANRRAQDTIIIELSVLCP